MAIVQISRIQHRSGLGANLPQLSKAELGYSVDQRKLYIGNGTLADGAPETGNTEILTEYSDILNLANTYTYKNTDAGYNPVTGGAKAQYNAVTYGASIYVAVGTNGNILISSDGINWSNTKSGTTNNLLGVAYGAGKFVAVGGNGTIIYSTDGTVWKQAGVQQDFVSTTTYNANDLVNYQGTTYKALSTTLGYLPTNATYWTTYSLSLVAYTTINDIIYGASKFVLVTLTGSIYSSLDGITWTLQSGVTPAITTSLQGLCYSGSKYVAVGTGGKVAVSTDGITWTSSSITSYDLYGVHYQDSAFIAVGGNSKVFYSTDAVTWSRSLIDAYTGVTNDGTNAFYITSWGDVYKNSGTTISYLSNIASGLENVTTLYYGIGSGKFVALTGSGGIYTSTNGIAWTAQTSGVSTGLNRAYYDNTNTRWIVVGNSGVILTSPDAVTWTSRTSGTSNNLYGINQITGSTYFIVGASGTVLTGTNSTSWTAQSTGLTTDLNSVTINSTKAVAVGASGIGVYSTDSGVTWISALANSATDPSGNTVAVGNLNKIIWNSTISRYIAVGDNGVVAVSATALPGSWTTRTTYTQSNLMDLTYVNTYFYVGGDIGLTYLTSTDASTWNTSTQYFGTNLIAPYLFDTAYNNNVNVIVGQYGLVYYGTQQHKYFKKTSNSLTYDLEVVVYNTQFVAAGANGQLSYSTDGLTWTSQSFSVGSARTVRPLQNKLDDFVSVKDFGAKGDGATDDTEAINRALYEIYCRSSSLAARKILYFPAGNYVISSDIKVPSHAILMGEGAYNTVITQTRSPYIAPYITWVIYTADNLQQTQSLIGLNGASLPTDITIQNMSLNSTGDGIIVDSASRVTLTNVRFKGPKTSVSTLNDAILGVPTSAIRINGQSLVSSSDFNVTDCLFDGFNVGIYLPSGQNLTNTLIDSCTFENLYQGVYFAGTSAKNVTLTNSIMDLVYDSGCYITNATNFLSMGNYYRDVANDLRGYTLPASVIIYFDSTAVGCGSIADQFDRTDTYNLTVHRVSETASSVEWNLSTGLRLGAFQQNMGKSVTLAASTTAALGVNFDDWDQSTGFEFIYTIVRNSQVRTGRTTFTKVLNGAFAIDDDSTQTGDVGVTFTYSSSDIQYISDTNGTGTLNYAIRYLEMV
jgi:hypothetical protein